MDFKFLTVLLKEPDASQHTQVKALYVLAFSVHTNAVTFFMLNQMLTLEKKNYSPFNHLFKIKTEKKDQ